MIMAGTMSENEIKSSTNFIRTIIDEDLKTNKFQGRVHTRFPPEPNGYLHIGHAKSICLNFGIAVDYNGKCNLRFDDTNPAKEEDEYVKSIIEDVRWLGFNWGDKVLYASDYFDKMYEYAVQMVKQSRAYVDDLTSDEIREYRGTLKEPGRESPYRRQKSTWGEWSGKVHIATVPWKKTWIYLKKCETGIFLTAVVC